MASPVADESPGLTIVKIAANPFLRGSAGKCTSSIFRNFFFLQYRGVFFPGRIPVTKVDHPLDEKIPFTPGRIAVYLDFVAFWIRILGFLLRHFGRRALAPVKNFIDSMGALYAFAAEVYSQNFSTTNRPRYLARPRFVLIHAVDPHLMCIPSLHVMVMIRSYTMFEKMLNELGPAETFAPQIEEIKQGALAITEAVLYVKQHSVNCISAAMYAMTRFDETLFPPDEAERFAAKLFVKPGKPSGDDAAAIRSHISSLYRRFLEDGRSAARWEDPLLAFLQAR
ncbi:hypothetical protein AGMMS49928_10930 [Spirochaetia bacterium]|nr:hypothetical protein AGMMS49928_10930 [Spirochaetia bacterium]